MHKPNPVPCSLALKEIDCIFIPFRTVSMLPSGRVILPRRFHIKSILSWLLGHNWEVLSFMEIQVENFNPVFYPSNTTWRKDNFKSFIKEYT